MKRTVLLIITAVFFAAMIVLTFSAESIHNASLPRVTVSRPPKHTFTEQYTNENGDTNTFFTEKTALTAEQIDEGVYVIYKAEKNGTERTFVRLAQVETGVEQDGFFEITSGLMPSDRFVVSSDMKLYDGEEVIVTQ